MTQNPSTRGWIGRLTVSLVLVAGAVTVTPAYAQRGDVYRESPSVMSAFRNVVEQAREWVVEVQCEGRRVALGTVVGADGWILTKASEIAGDVVCRLRDGNKHHATVAGIHPEFDLALLKIDAQNLAACQWGQVETYFPGQWVASAGMTRDPLALGVVSVAPRPIPAQPGVLGVRIEDADGGVLVAEAMSNKAAAKAGLRDGDVIIGLDGQTITNRQQLVQAVQTRSPGSLVRIKFRRDDEENEVVARLGRPDPAMQDRLGGRLSERSEGFPLALQHDSVLDPAECGGPLLGLDGKVLGLNIARSGRVMSYAIPAKEVLAVLPELQSGKFAPPAPPTTVVATKEAGD